HRHSLCGRHGRLPHLRLCCRDPRRHGGGRDDRGLGALALRRALPDCAAHRQRGARGQPRRLRHHFEAARHHRVGMNVLILGSGGREHAIAWKLRQSAKLTDLWVAPGNAGTAALARNLDLSANDADGIIAACREHRIDLVVVGPEQPLAEGLVDRLAAEGIAAFGPSREAARIESSKAFAKDLLLASDIPTAASATFTSLTAARDYVIGLAQPPVVKADGLAGGKGAFVCDSKDEALKALSQMMEERVFGEAGGTVVIEERLSGREVSA